MTGRLLVDDLVNPLDWLSSVKNTEGSVCLDAKINDLRFVGEELLVVLSYGDQSLTVTLSEKNLKTLTITQAAEFLSKYRGNYLLRALSHKIPEDR